MNGESREGVSSRSTTAEWRTEGCQKASPPPLRSLPLTKGTPPTTDSRAGPESQNPPQKAICSRWRRRRPDAKRRARVLVVVLMKQRQKSQKRLADSASALRAECCRSTWDSAATRPKRKIDERKTQ